MIVIHCQWELVQMHTLHSAVKFISPLSKQRSICGVKITAVYTVWHKSWMHGEIAVGPKWHTSDCILLYVV